MGDFSSRRTDQQITAQRLIHDANELAATMRLFYDSNFDGQDDLQQATWFSYSIELNAPNEDVYQKKLEFIFHTQLGSKIERYFLDYRTFIGENFRRVATTEYQFGLTYNRCQYGMDYQLINGATALSQADLIDLQTSNQNLFALLSDRPISVECDAPFYDPLQWCDTSLSEVAIVERGVQFYVGNLIPYGEDVASFKVTCDVASM